VLFCSHEINPLLRAVDRVLYLGNGKAAIGGVDEVINGPVLSKLYGTSINVMRVGGRIFVMADDVELEGGRMSTMFDYEFMRNAFYACTIVGIVAGGGRLFPGAQGQTFAGHALAHVGFPAPPAPA